MTDEATTQMTKNLTEEGARKLVELVGREGAIAAIANSKDLSIQALESSALALGLTLATRETKRRLAARIIQFVDKRIKKTIDELKTMSRSEIVEYLEKTNCSYEEMVDLLGTIEMKSRVKSRRAMIDYVASQISSLGVFERVADGRAGHPRSSKDSKTIEEREGDSRLQRSSRPLS